MRIRTGASSPIVLAFLVGCHTAQTERATGGVTALSYSRSPGRSTAGIIPYSDLFGEMRERGTDPGLAKQVPPMLPVQTVSLAGYALGPILFIGALATGDAEKTAAILDRWVGMGETAAIEHTPDAAVALRGVDATAAPDLDTAPGGRGVIGHGFRGHFFGGPSQAIRDFGCEW